MLMEIAIYLLVAVGIIGFLVAIFAEFGWRE